MRSPAKSSASNCYWSAMHFWVVFSDQRPITLHWIRSLQWDEPSFHWPCPSQLSITRWIIKEPLPKAFLQGVILNSGGLLLHTMKYDNLIRMGWALIGFYDIQWDCSYGANNRYTQVQYWPQNRNRNRSNDVCSSFCILCFIPIWARSHCVITNLMDTWRSFSPFPNCFPRQWAHPTHSLPTF